jgi:hypothetical protein
MSDTKNIIIYPHLKFSLNDGGIVVQYYLAQVLDSLGINVKIYNVHDNNSKNIIFNKFVNDINTIDFNNTIVIYSEGILHNPLHAKYVVRWMLSKLGENVPHLNYKSWNENELVYFFNNEIEMVNNNVPRKMLSLFYIYPNIKAHNFKRNGLCYTIRKGMNQIQIDQSRFKELPRFEITREHKQEQYVTIFNNFEYFVSYDALTFLNIIAALCGCISIIHPVEGISKQEYFKMTALYDYMVDKNITEIYGLAYGYSDEEIDYSRSTLHLVKDQITDIQNWLIENSVKKFVEDMNNWDLNKNKINTYKNTMLVVDVFFYKNLYVDLQWMTDEQLFEHYHNHGIKEGRIANKDEFSKLYPNFNLDFYKYYNTDITWMNEYQLIHHYHHHGRFEDRQICENNLPNDFSKDWGQKEAIYYYKNYGFFESFRKYKIIDSLYIAKPYSNPSDIYTFLSRPVINYSNSFLKIDDFSQNLPRGIHNNKEICSFNTLSSFVLLIDFLNGGGGTSFFIESIISKYKKYQTFLIARNFNGQIYFTINDDYQIEQSYNTNDACNLLFNNKDKIEKIFMNHSMYHSKDFLDNLFKLNKKITTITHDFLLLFNDPQIEFNNIDNYVLDSSKHNKININKYDEIITQNTGNLFIYNNYIEDKNKIIITPLPDFKNSKDLINTSNTDIVVGIIGALSDVKGRLELEKIILYFKNSNIKIILFGYTEIDSFQNFYQYKDVNELNQLLITHKPNVLLELSIWPETYSYTLTLAMITQLPILYLKKNGYSVVENRLSNYDKCNSFASIEELHILIIDKKQDFFYTIEPVIYFNEFWDNYFITKKEKKTIIKGKNIHDIKPYIIYFPQFHEIPENNISFYHGFNDIKNLDLLSKSCILVDIETPSLKEFNLQNITEYDYINKKSILQKQIDIIDEYNISGLAIYYYWFSINTITNQNLIMENVINQFFDGSIDMKNKKCFLIWANESWTNNPAFGTTNERIETDYTFSTNFEIISENLLTYFKNDTYLKIDNKPVFELHHPWFITLEQINTFYNIIQNKCIENNFDGIHFIVNSINGTYDKYINRCHHFNYRKSNSCFFDNNLNKNLLNYKIYLNNDIKENNEIETIVFDFDNRARMIEPNKLHNTTICINNTEVNKKKFMEKIINKYNKYKQSEVDNILVINSLNEWGEKMSLEPSEEYGYYYLNLLSEGLQDNI